MKEQDTEYEMKDYIDEICDSDDLQLEETDSEEIDKEEYNLENYFKYIEGLSRSDLIILLKWEIQNRLAMTDSMDDLETRLHKLEFGK